MKKTAKTILIVVYLLIVLLEICGFFLDCNHIMVSPPPDDLTGEREQIAISLLLLFCAILFETDILLGVLYFMRDKSQRKAYQTVCNAICCALWLLAFVSVVLPFVYEPAMSLILTVPVLAVFLCFLCRIVHFFFWLSTHDLPKSV